jgi:hypothetical protein
VIAISKADLKRYQDELAGVLRDLGRQIELSCRAFNRNRKEPVTPEKPASTREVDREGTIFRWISEGLQEGLGEQELTELLRIRSVLAFVRGVEQPVTDLLACVDRKIDQRTLFSDAAVREANDLFAKGRFIMIACADAVQTGNPLLKAHVICGAEYVLQLVERYTRAHETRLAQGQCKPKASVEFTCMLTAFGTIHRYLKEVASHIPGEIELETWACPSRTEPEQRAAQAGPDGERA